VERREKTTPEEEMELYEDMQREWRRKHRMETYTMAKKEQEENFNPNPDENEYRDVEGVEVPDYGLFYQWGEIGETIEGTYTRKRINPARTGDDGRRFRQQNLYDIKGNTDELWTLNGNFDLDGKMKKVRVGSRVKITYTEDRDVGANINPMRIFRVRVAPAKK
jgi:hypothetical protein